MLSRLAFAALVAFGVDHALSDIAEGPRLVMALAVFALVMDGGAK